jgi:hypothetical protein
MVKSFENADGTAQRKKSKNKIDAQVIIKKNKGREQTQLRYKKIARIQHVIIGEIISVAIVIKIGSKRVINSQMEAFDNGANMIKIISQCCPEIFNALVIKIGVTSFKNKL